MGAWSAGINGNDTAQDLWSEYTAAFWYYDVPTALDKIEGYVRTMFDETDEDEWCCYVYSLADFMWKKGILTEEVRDRAVGMIDSGFGLDAWREAGEKTLQKRQKALQELRTELLSPLPPKKRIKPDVHTSDYYEIGDVFAVQFQTKDKPFVKHKDSGVTQEAFEALGGKYFLVQKVAVLKSWQSACVPEVADHWLIFRLFAGIYDRPPALHDVGSLTPVDIEGVFPTFITESSGVYFKRRKAVLLTNDKSGCEDDPDKTPPYLRGHIYFGINKPWSNPDSVIAASLLRGSTV